jgi:hypothetical protein
MIVTGPVPRHPARRAIARKAGQAGGAGGVESARLDEFSTMKLGNFPQAFTHLSLINATITLDHQLDHGVGFDPIRRVNAVGAG